MATTLQQIEDFLALKRVAVVGVTRDPKGFGNVLWQEFRQRRYEAVPVNPAATEIDGQRCYASVGEIDPPVEGALIMTKPGVAEQVVEQCAAAGIHHVWLYGGMAGPGAVSRAAIDYCATHDIDVVAGQCPYMFLADTPFVHTLHGLGKKLTGRYPR